MQSYWADISINLWNNEVHHYFEVHHFRIISKYYRLHFLFFHCCCCWGIGLELSLYIYLKKQVWLCHQTSMSTPNLNQFFKQKQRESINQTKGKKTPKIKELKEKKNAARSLSSHGEKAIIIINIINIVPTFRDQVYTHKVTCLSNDCFYCTTCINLLVSLLL